MKTDFTKVATQILTKEQSNNENLQPKFSKSDEINLFGQDDVKFCCNDNEKQGEQGQIFSK